jgi:hypothetical protein
MLILYICDNLIYIHTSIEFIRDLINVSQQNTGNDHMIAEEGGKRTLDSDAVLSASYKTYRKWMSVERLANVSDLARMAGKNLQRFPTHSQSRSFPSYRCRRPKQGRARRKPCSFACSRTTCMLPKYSGRWSCRRILQAWPEQLRGIGVPDSRRQSWVRQRYRRSSR